MVLEKEAAVSVRGWDSQRGARELLSSLPQSVCVSVSPKGASAVVAVSQDQKNAPLLLVVADAGFRNEIRSVLSGISLGDRSCFWLAKVLLF